MWPDMQRAYAGDEWTPRPNWTITGGVALTLVADAGKEALCGKGLAELFTQAVDNDVDNRRTNRTDARRARLLLD